MNNMKTLMYVLDVFTKSCEETAKQLYRLNSSFNKLIAYLIINKVITQKQALAILDVEELEAVEEDV